MKKKHNKENEEKFIDAIGSNSMVYGDEMAKIEPKLGGRTQTENIEDEVEQMENKILYNEEIKESHRDYSLSELENIVKSM